MEVQGQGIVWSSDLLASVLRREVKNSRRMRFWVDKWMDDSTLSDRCTHPVVEEALQACVEVFWENGCGWKWELLGNTFQSSTLLKMASATVDVERGVWNLIISAGLNPIAKTFL